YNFSNGNLLETITGLSCGSGSSGDNVAVAVDPYYIYTWDASTRTVYVYNHSGTLQRTMTLDYGNYGFSLSCFEGFLFVAVDGNYSTGTWYGYNIRRSVNQTKSAEINKTLNLKSSNITIKPDFDSTDK
ncbi:MAG: hypothetical protein JXA39_02085, partial [Bacteroidales bacterium]|nr:hypothetical protein [Bacteroidales bacterium]